MSRIGTVVLALLFTSVVASTQTTNKEPDYGLLNAIASCDSVSCVVAKQNKAQQKVESIVLYTKWLLLDPNNRTASKRLLENLPTSEADVAAMMMLPDWHEGATKSEADMKRLDTVYENWPRLLSIAVRQFPQYLPAYIRYGRLAVNDIHSDYTGFERNVCRADRNKFVAAFRSLSVDDQRYIRQYVFNPYSCKPVFVSEAD